MTFSSADNCQLSYYTVPAYNSTGAQWRSVECLTRDGRAAGLSLTGVTALCPGVRHINPRLVLVQPRKTRPFISERLLMGRKESNQTNKTFNSTLAIGDFCHLLINLANNFTLILLLK